MAILCNLLTITPISQIINRSHLKNRNQATETVFNSVAKTHRLVIAHEAVKDFGIGAEITAATAEEIMNELDGPIIGVGAPFVGAPFSLE